jgi:glycosyltransferase involved in cell wall biosynthesis
VSRDTHPLVGIDARKIRDFGIGSYVRNLLESLARRPESLAYRFRIFTRLADRDALPALPSHFDVATEEASGYSLSELTGFAWRLWRHRLDLFHATHYVLPPLPRGRAVVTIHDIIHLLYPQFLPNRAAHLYARIMIRRALKRADRIITVSHNSKRDLVDHFGVGAERVEVVYNGVPRGFRSDVPGEERRRVARKLNLTSPYLLFLGGDRPHKNARNVIRAFAEARRREPLPHTLVLAGPMPKNAGRIEALISALDCDTAIRRTGVVDDADMPGLFAGADAFLYPTLYEGFGLPVIEAMACGTPVLTSSTSALQEIAGGHALLVDPMDAGAIATGIVTLATNPVRRAELAKLGLARAADFSWNKAADATLGVYAVVLRTRREA